MLRIVLMTSLAIGTASATLANDVDAYPAGTFQKILASFPEGDAEINVEMFSAASVADIFAVYHNDFGKPLQVKKPTLVVADADS